MTRHHRKASLFFELVLWQWEAKDSIVRTRSRFWLCTFSSFINSQCDEKRSDKYLPSHLEFNKSLRWSEMCHDVNFKHIMFLICITLTCLNHSIVHFDGWFRCSFPHLHTHSRKLNLPLNFHLYKVLLASSRSPSLLFFTTLINVHFPTSRCVFFHLGILISNWNVL